MKNKQKNGQKFGPRMAKALLIRCNNLEDCVLSQQKTISQLESQIVNDNLGHQLMEKRYNEMLTYVELKRPDVERLIKLQTKRKALQLTSGGMMPEIKLTVVKRKKKVKIPEQMKLSEADEVTMEELKAADSLLDQVESESGKEPG